MTTHHTAEDDAAAIAGVNDYRPHHHESTEGGILSEALSIRDVVIPYQEELDKIAANRSLLGSRASATEDPPSAPVALPCARAESLSATSREAETTDTRGRAAQWITEL